jgi:hypothetical protein
MNINIKLIIGLLFIGVMSCTKDIDTHLSNDHSTPETTLPTEINVDEIIFPTSGDRSGILLQTIDFPASGTQYDYLVAGQNAKHTIINHSPLDSTTYHRWNVNAANFGTFMGSNFIKTRYYKNGTIKLDSVVTTTAYGPNFTIYKPPQAILRDGMKGMEYTWSKSSTVQRSYLHYRGETVSTTQWTHTIDDSIIYTKDLQPETSKTKNWQLKHIMK